MSETKYQPVALITGATSGIGLEYAWTFANMGYDILLTGQRGKILKRLCSQIKNKHNIKAEYITGNLALAKHIKELCELISQTPNLHVLINNAGYTRLQPFYEDNVNAQADILKVHAEAALKLSHSAIPVLKKHTWGAIINVSSIAAFNIGYKDLLYNASKAFLLNFSESLHLLLNNTGIKVQVLCPGFTKTDFHMKLGMDNNHPFFSQHKFMSTKEVVHISLRCLEKNKVVCIPGLRNKLRILLMKYIPRKLLYNLHLAKKTQDATK